jgi:hypothetical protein
MKQDVALYFDRLKQEVATSARSSKSATGRARIIFALDATASRETTWDQACHVQGTMFEAVAGLGGLNVKLMFYRGFNECKASKWFSTAGDLHRVMRQVSCVGGNTQIERVLEHAIAEAKRQPLGAVIFIGDAMEESADRLCHLAGELGAVQTPIFVFHEGRDPIAGGTFRQLAQLSAGAYLPFDLASIHRLKELLGAIAVYATGDYPALAAYGEKYGGTVLQLTHRMRRL